MDNNFVKDITNIEDDFARWYTDVVIKSELADYTDVKGFITYRPYGYAIWENIQAYADKKFKEHGVKNVAMPVLIPERLLNKEKNVDPMWIKTVQKIYDKNNYTFNAYSLKATYARPSQAERMKNG